MFGDSLLVEGKTYYAFPVPEGIASGKPGHRQGDIVAPGFEVGMDGVPLVGNVPVAKLP